MQDVLVLNSDYNPLQVVPWERAVSLLLEEKVLVVKEYKDRFIRSTSMQMPWPSVVALKTYVNQRGKVKFKRFNVFIRDSYMCAYCGVQPLRFGRPDRAALTMDHVIPRSRAIIKRQGRGTVSLVYTKAGRELPVTGWLNIVTSCKSCNTRKADRTPEEAKMPMLFKPYRPGPMQAFKIMLERKSESVPEAWEEHL